MIPPNTESYFISLDHDVLHLKRIYRVSHGIPVLMIHGSVSNGRIFYSSSHKGLAPYLAACGCDVYVADLRGRGQSTPTVHAHSAHSQTQSIVEDLPAFIQQIQAIRGNTPIHIVAHSWGGVLTFAYLARQAQHSIASVCCLGSKRAVGLINPYRWYKLDLLWGIGGELLTRRYGYLPAKKAKFGSDNESVGVYQGCKQWVYARHEWRDPEDGFDYRLALRRRAAIPPSLFIAGAGDRFLGHPNDVRLFMDEIGHPDSQFRLLSRKNGDQLDYDHLQMCIAPEARNDHFPEIYDWLQRHHHR